jgi:thioredoxin reductase (NADPH)
MTGLVPIGVAMAIAMFALGQLLESSARKRRLGAELARPPQTPPSLYPRIDADACVCTGACIDACPERDVIAIIDGRPRLVRASACVCHADCLRSCPVSAIELVLGSPERAVEVPVMTGSFETTVPGLYVAGEISDNASMANLAGTDALDPVLALHAAADHAATEEAGRSQLLRLIPELVAVVASWPACCLSADSGPSARGIMNLCSNWHM